MFTMHSAANVNHENDYDLCIGSLNVRGINSDVKRNSIFKWVKKNKFDITMLQETFSSVEHENVWRRTWEGDIIFSHGTKHSRGTIVLFNKGLDYVIEKQHCDPNGRFIIIKAKVHDEKFNLINIYAPNKASEKKIFFSGIYNALMQLGVSVEDRNIFGGDWNCIFDDNLDKSGGKRNSENLPPNEMKLFMDDFSIVDVWRIQNPTCKRYTYRQKSPLIQTRLDFYLISNSIQDMVKDCNIIPSVWSDHSSITIKLKFLKDWPKGNNHWKFNATYVEDEIYVNELNAKIDEWLISYSNIEDKQVRWELLKYEIRKFSITYGKNRKTC